MALPTSGFDPSKVTYSMTLNANGSQGQIQIAVDAGALGGFINPWPAVEAAVAAFRTTWSTQGGGQVTMTRQTDGTIFESGL